MTEEDYKQAEESFSGSCAQTDKPARLVSIKTKLQAQQCCDLLLTEMASGIAGAFTNTIYIFWRHLQNI